MSIGKFSYNSWMQNIWLIIYNIILTYYVFRFGPYFVSPVIAGLDKISDTEYKPVICTYDSIGYREHNGQFEVAGTGA